MTALCLIPIIMLYAAGNIPAARAAYKQCAPPAAGTDFRLRPGRDCHGADFRRGQAEPRARANIPRGDKKSRRLAAADRRVVCKQSQPAYHRRKKAGATDNSDTEGAVPRRTVLKNPAYPIRHICRQNNRHGGSDRPLFPKKVYMYLRPHGCSHRKCHHIVFDIATDIAVQQRRHRARHFAGRAVYPEKQAYRAVYFYLENHNKKYSGKKY